MIEITTNKLATRKKVLIDGHSFIVRRLGAGDELTLTQYMREINKLQTKEQLTEQDEERAVTISKKTMQMMAGCFDDGGDGSKSTELVNRLSVDELNAVLTEIFKENDAEIS